MRVLALVALLAPTALVGACGAATPTGSPGQGGNDGPPPITLLTTPAVDLAPGSSCWSENGGGRCADMETIPTRRLPVVTTEQVRFRFDVDDTTFHASLVPLEHGQSTCRRVYPGHITDQGDHDHVLMSSAPAGRYRVTLVGYADAGEAVGGFVWSTTSDGVPVEPSAEVSIVWSPHGHVEGQGFNLRVSDLPTTPGSASAAITGTAANGASHTFDAGTAHVDCDSVSFYETGDLGDSQRVAELGPAPFTYDVTLTLDGTTYRASATWPDDHVDVPDSDNPAPVPLHFTPPLPGS